MRCGPGKVQRDSGRERIVLVLVVVLVLEKTCRSAATLILRARPQSPELEGSRFVRWQLYRLAAGGSRE